MNLSADNLIDILSNLDHDALAQICTANKAFSVVCQSERLWEVLTKRKYGTGIKKLGSWYYTYQGLNRPVYTVMFSGNPEYVTSQFGVFYSFESAADSLLNNPNINVFSDIDYTAFGYSALANDFILESLSNYTIPIDFEHAINGTRYQFDDAEVEQLRQEVNKFNQEYKSLAYKHLKLHPKGDVNDSSEAIYAIEKTVVSP